MNDLTAISDSILITCDPQTLFTHLTDADLLKQWWPMDCRSDPRKGGVLKLVWFNNSALTTVFDIFEPPVALGYDFYHERVDFRLETAGEGRTRLSVTHDKVAYASDNLQGVIHVAQVWSSLLLRLQTLIEHDIILDGRGE